MPNATLPATVEVPTDAIIDAAATFDAYANLVIIASGRQDHDGATFLWGPARALLGAAGLDEEETRQALDVRMHEISARMLRTIAAFALAESDLEEGFAERDRTDWTQ